MVGGKSLEGIPFTLRCAVFGVPSNLTTLQELYLDLNVEIGRAVQTHTAVEAQSIAFGRPGPWTYYLMLAGGDVAQAAKMQGRAYMHEMMNHAH